MWRGTLRLAVVLTSIAALVLAEPVMAAHVHQVRLPIEIGQQQWAVMVAPGDHLWKISETHLTVLRGTTPGDSEISPYWRQVIELNGPRLRSGDPDLIYPGEMVEMPFPNGLP